MEVKRNDFVLQKEKEYLEAEAYKTKAQLDYVAMMADVELPSEDEQEAREVSENE